MLSRDQFDGWLLEHLYGLLEPEAEQQMQAYLAAHPEAAAARDRAARLLSAAARQEFADLRFEAPPSEPAVPARPAKPQPAGWGRWVVAAGLFLAVGVLGVPAGYLGLEQYRARTAVAQARERLELASAARQKVWAEQTEEVSAKTRALEEAQRAVGTAHQAVSEKVEQATREVLARQMFVQVVGPATVQAGAPNDYRIETRDLNGRPVGARVTVRVRDRAADKLVLEQKDVEINGIHRLMLPPDLQVRAGTDLALEVIAARDGMPQSKVEEKVRLAAPTYITHLATDKPMYKPGESVFFRSLTLNRSSLVPAAEDLRLHFQLIDPQGVVKRELVGTARLVRDNGQPVLGPDGKPLTGIGSGAFPLDESWPGGEYVLKVTELNNKFPPQQRKLLVNKYTPDRLQKQLEFARKTYAPGDEVVANCKVTDAQGSPLADKLVAASAQVDGTPVQVTPPGRTDAAGCVSVRLKLPAQIEHGSASVTVTFDDGAGPEAIVRPIPVVLKKLFIDFYPEGGDLVAGLPGRVYFQARTTLGKPAELTGKIVDDQGKAVAEAVTFNDDKEPGINQGMGMAAFTPEKGRTYRLAIDTPTGIEGEFKLPAAREDGVALSVPSGVTVPGQAIQVKVASTKERTLLVGAYARGRTLDQQQVKVEAGKPTEVTLKPESGLGGVARVTVFEVADAGGQRQDLKPVAERLVYRKPSSNVDLAVRPTKSRYAPGDPVELSVAALREDGAPAPAVVMLAVVNESVITMADEKTYRSMPTHVLLTSEVNKPEELEHADVLLGQHPKAATALDLLLGTQGWRRFAEQDPAKFRQAHPQEADRMMVAVGNAQPTPLLAGSLQEARTKAFQQAQADVAAAREKLDIANADYQAAVNDPDRARRLNETNTAFVAAQADFNRAAAALNGLEASARRLREVLLPYLAALLLGAGLVALVMALTRSLKRAVPYYAAAGVAVGLCGFLVAGLVMLGDEQRMMFDMAGGNAPAVAMAPNMDLRDRAAQEEPEQAMPFADALDGGFPQAAGVVPLAPRAAPPGMPLDEQAKAARFIKNAEGFAPGRAEKDLQNRQGDLKADRFGKAKGEAADKEMEQRKQLMDLRKGAAKPALEAQMDQKRRNRGAELERGDAAAMMPKPAAGLAAAMPLAPEAPPFPGMFGRRGRPHADFDYVPPPLVIREYAHQHEPVGASDVRTDFTETVLWQPALVLDVNGTGKVNFSLSDNIGRSKVFVAAHTLDGRIGSAIAFVEARKPFSIDPRLPIEVTSSDIIDVPVSMINDSFTVQKVTVESKVAGMRLVPGTAGQGLADAAEQKLTLNPDQRARRVFRFQPLNIEGQALVEFHGTAEPFEPDRIRRTIPVVADGFPVTNAHSDLLEGTATVEMELPESVLRGTLKVTAHAFPSTLANLQKGLEGLLREPNGCFEQTSTSSYPNLLILDYLQTSDQANPEVARRAKDLLDRGYKRLIGFECQKQGGGREGYEWFGGAAPPHEALTAYGLLQFRDMTRVYDVDSQMLERTRAYLMSRRDGKGGFLRNPRALDSFGAAPPHITDAYIVWALTESGNSDDLTKELDSLKERAGSSKDPYFLALVANSLLNRGQQAPAVELLEKVVKMQDADGAIKGAETSITRSGGRTLEIETTALATLGWLKANRLDLFAAATDKAVRWIGQQRGGYGGFGSTQSTILALRSLIAHAKANAKTASAGELRMYVGDQVVETLKFPAGASETLTLELKAPETVLKRGKKNLLKLEVSGDNKFPFTLAWEYRTLKPASAEGCAVKLTTGLDRDNAVEGESVRLTATIENVSGKGHGMTVAIIGLPAGLKLPEDMKQLKDLAALQENGTKRGTIDAFEIRGRELVLYWRDLAPQQKTEVNVDLICNVPGQYRGPASRAYLYYNADTKHWVDPLSVAVAVKPE